VEALILRLDAPLMSFGAVIVDNIGVTGALPGRSMLTGLLGNALGYRHGDDTKLQDLQDRIQYAVRCDRSGQTLVDFQTVDLSMSHMEEGWTTRGHSESRDGGPSAKGTHIRYRHFLADAVYTIALTLDPPESDPTVATLATALDRPARPLFIGRKACLPSVPILTALKTGSDLRAILRDAPHPDAGHRSDPPWRAWWPVDERFDERRERKIALYDDRDWTNQIHTGRRWMVEGSIDE
jgi:CRISPR system Cascade subunit CasD